MFFSNIRHHVLFGRIDFYCPCIRKVSFFVGQFSFPISRVVPASPELRPCTRPSPGHTRNRDDRQASSCQETRPISHIFVPIIGDRSRGGIRRGISPWMTKQLNHLCWQTWTGTFGCISRVGWWLHSSIPSLFHCSSLAFLKTNAKKRIAKGIQSCLAVSFQTSKALVKAFFPTKTCHHFLVGYTPLTGSETRKPVDFSVKHHHQAKNSYLYALSNKFRSA